ncbi:hypothetical protein [uncultured Parolsenella sp.]|uniref:hypothetical protein n=1 Tax=uncultured Parolsenella sp. TaxID=2083008 RepID=UPI0025FC2DCC|nr:hypothetical protein [uncultured Parolsenella sp.]
MPSGASSAGRMALGALVAALAVAAGLLVVCVVVLALPVGGLREFQLELGMAVQAAVPGPVRGLLVVSIPGGGSLRGDFLLCALVLVLLDWGLSALSERLR